LREGSRKESTIGALEEAVMIEAAHDVGHVVSQPKKRLSVA